MKQRCLVATCDMCCTLGRQLQHHLAGRAQLHRCLVAVRVAVIVPVRGSAAESAQSERAAMAMPGKYTQLQYA